MDLCANPSCCLEDGHVGDCRDGDSMQMMCVDCGAELDADERRFVELRADRRHECVSCWSVRVLGRPREATMPAPPPSDTIPCGPVIAFLEDVDDVYAATSLPRVS